MWWWKCHKMDRGSWHQPGRCHRHRHLQLGQRQISPDEPAESGNHGLVHWDAFGFGSEICKMLGVPDNRNVAFALRARVEVFGTGAGPESFNSFLLLQGLETLSLRVERHTENAMALQAGCRSIRRWPMSATRGCRMIPNGARRYLTGRGMGCMLMFSLTGGYDDAVRFIDSLELASHLANVGDAETLVIHPASTTHQQLSERSRPRQG